MDKLIVLGTGHAGVTKCYNTCFALTNDKNYLLADTGGGNGIIGRLEEAQIPLGKIHHVFVSHKHTDHVLGLVWVIRRIGQLIHGGQYEGNLTIYCHEELVHTIRAITDATLDKPITDLIGERILLRVVGDGEKEFLDGYEVTFFDIHSLKVKQFGFKMRLSTGKNLTFLGDEPYNPLCRNYVENSEWLLSEAFCVYSERDIYKPYEKHHSTVKEACELAEELNIKNLVLWHTEDQNLAQRKKLYINEGKNYFKGNLYVPDDLEVILL